MKDRMERFWENYSQEQLDKIQAETSPESYLSDWTSGKTVSNVEDIIEKTFNIKCSDGKEFCYKFLDGSRLLWEADEKSGEAYYRAEKVPGHQEVIFVHHIMDGIIPVKCMDLVLDMETGQATVVAAEISNEMPYPRDVKHTISFGCFIDSANKSPLEINHCYTDELIGKAILWDMPSYMKKPPIKHIYLSPKYYGIYMTREDKCYMTVDPADYVKIKDNLYLLSIIEKHRSGIQLTFVINTELMEDIVGHFGISAGNEADGSAPKVVCTMITGRKGTFVPMETK